MKRIVLIAIALMLISVQSRARDAAASTIEWLSCKSEVILVGKITKIEVTKGEYSVIYEDCTVQVQKIIKGDIKGEDIVFCLRTLSSNPTAKVFMNSDKGILLFLSKSTDHGPEQHLDNKYVPTSMESPFSILDLSNVTENVYSKQMKILTDTNEILSVTRLWADSKVSQSLWSEVPSDSLIHKSPHSFYLLVPAEETYRAQFMKMAQSDQPHERQEAASELSKFPSDETEGILRKLLKDDTVNFWHPSADTISNVEFGVRTAAYNSLKVLGKPVPEKIELKREPTEEEQRSLRHNHWRKSFGYAFSDGWKVTSIVDADTRRIEGRDMTSVILTCGKEESHCRVTLTPKEFDSKDLPGGEDLGINGRNNGGARRFFLKGALPQEEKERLIKYFGLERF